MILPQSISNSFSLPGAVSHSGRFGNGLINDTYLVATRDDEGNDAGRFIFQRINDGVFRDPDRLMDNVGRVCRHWQRKLQSSKTADPRQQCLSIVPTWGGEALHCEAAEDGRATPSFWRCFEYIDGCTSHEVVDSPNLAYEAALQFGRFQRSMADFEGERLIETIPDFHHTPKRVQALKAAIASDPLGRAAGCRQEILFALGKQDLAHRLRNLHRSGLIPERIIHNDTKISNVLICNETQRGVCVVDLDTVMPGLSLYDFGDLVRSTISPLPEDSTDLNAIEVRLPVFEALATGFLEAMADVLTPAEHENLAFSGFLLTYEVGIRFLTDHLLGDGYFGAKYADHNLHRARNQFEILRQLKARESELIRHQLSA